MKVIIVKEMMICDVSPVAMFWLSSLFNCEGDKTPDVYVRLLLPRKRFLCCVGGGWHLCGAISLLRGCRWHLCGATGGWNIVSFPNFKPFSSFPEIFSLNHHKDICSESSLSKNCHSSQCLPHLTCTYTQMLIA